MSAHTQRVTAVDIGRGRVRFPRSAKRLLPAGRTTINVVLRGSSFTARYDPRTGPDRARSAVLKVRTEVLTRLVKPDEVLMLSVKPSGSCILD